MNYRENKLGLKVLTDDGYKSFSGIAHIGNEIIYRINIEDNLFLECSGKHRLYVDDMKKISVKDLTNKNLVNTVFGKKKIISIIKTDRVEPVYDLIDVEGNHRYYTNSVLSSNCQFISSDETLIDSEFLVSKLKSKQEIFSIKKVRWFSEPEPNHIFGVSLDPSMGTGGDASAIQVFDLTTMTQIAEWKDNRTPTDRQLNVVYDILSYLYYTLSENPHHKGEPEIYWSYENNGCGEGIQVALKLIGEEKFPGTLISDTTKRNGMNTTMKNKLTACSIFKRMLEKKKLTIISAPLISQLKGFVYSGGSYKAKPGMNDDLVMATMLMIRIYEIVSKWEDNIADEGDLLDDDNDDDAPMPFGIV